MDDFGFSQKGKDFREGRSTAIDEFWQITLKLRPAKENLERRTDGVL
jgi:hypothetical protein